MNLVRQARRTVFGGLAVLIPFSCAGTPEGTTDNAVQRFASACTVPDYAVKAYGPGDQVQHHGALYQCKSWPASGWCGVGAAYEPGVGWAWGDAWDLLGSCAGTNTGGSTGAGGEGSSHCSEPSYVDRQAYAEGATVRNGDSVYQCKVAGWCSIGDAYAPGTGWAWTEAWTMLGPCSGGGGAGGAGGQMGGTGGSSGVGGSSSTGGTATGGNGTGGAAAGGSSGTGGTPSSDRLFVGYYQTWSDGWKANGADTALAHLPRYVNVVNLAFMEPNANYAAGSMSLGGTGIGVPYDGPTLRDAIAALHRANPDTKVLVSVGGATFPNWASFNPAAVASFVNDFGLDGVDIDYEPSNPNCAVNGASVTCPASDTQYVSVILAMRAALSRPKWLSIAAWSVGAYGENEWANAPPTGSSYAGIALAVFKSAAAANALDLVNVMSYDASPAYDPRQALQAYQHYFKGRIAMGIEVPPEAWGGHIYTIAEIDALADAVNAGGAAGLMLWSIQKPGPAQQFATEMCSKLGLGSCSTPML